MSLYSYNFHFLPRPNRNLFSAGSDSTRAIIPNFDTVDQLSEFTNRLQHWQVENFPGILIQLKVGASFVCLLIVIVAAILARRLYEHSLWFIRIIKRDRGTILVPNSILIFSLVEGLFGIIFVAFLWITTDLIQDTYVKVANYMLWLILPWCFLIIGAVWAAWGTYFATPNSLQSSINGNSTSSFFQRILLRPYVVNLTGVLTPLAMSISVLIPAILSNRYWQRSITMEKEWQATYSMQTSFNQDMVQSSQLIWYETLKGMKFACIAFLLWTIYALIVSLLYLSVSWGLISAIANELSKQQTAGTQTGIHQKTTTTIIDSGTNTNNVDKNVVSAAAQESGIVHPSNVGGNHLFTQAELEANTPCDSYYPAIRPHQVIGKQFTGKGVKNQSQGQKTRAVGVGKEEGQEQQVNQSDDTSGTAVTVRSSRQYLKSAMIHIIIQLIAVSPACLAFGSIALLLCLTMYGRLEQPSTTGGNQFEYYFGIALITVNWTTVLFGGITLVAIAMRTYEPVLSSTAALTNNPFHRHNSVQGVVNNTPKSPNTRQTTSSFFETHSSVKPIASVANKILGNRTPIREQRNLGQVEEGTELPNLNEVQGHFLIERTTVETYEERKKSMMITREATSYSGSDDDDEYFQGGIGRRKYSQRPTR